MNITEIFLEIFIIICFFRGAIDRSSIPQLKYLWEGMILVSNFIFIKPFLEQLRQNKKIKISYFLFIFSMLISSINSFRFSTGNLKNILYEGILINGFIIIIIIAISKRDITNIKRNLKTIFILSSIQILFDLKNVSLIKYIGKIDMNLYADMFPGSMFMPNQKSRFLILIIIIFCIYINENINTTKIKIILSLPLVMMISSYILGFSELTYVFIAASISIVVLKRVIINFKKIDLKYKIGMILLIIISYKVIDYKYLSAANFESIVIISKARFLNKDYGVYAVILYSIDIFIKSSFLGVGPGLFMTRAATALGAILLENSPRVMVNFGELSANISSVDGVSSLLIIVTEMGILGLMALIIFLKQTIFNYKLNKYGFIDEVITMYYILLLIYVPYMFDNEFGYLCALTVISFRRLFTSKEQNNTL